MTDNIILLDIAVISKDVLPVNVTTSNSFHSIELGNIEITENIFKKIFYPYGETFGIDKNIINNNNLSSYISFLPIYRTVVNPLAITTSDTSFSLIETIINNIETDLNITRSNFTIDSLLELKKDLCNINSLCDINCCSVIAALTWSDIMNIVKNEYFKQSGQSVNMYLAVNVLFKSPTKGVKPTNIKFKYYVNINVM